MSRIYRAAVVAVVGWAHSLTTSSSACPAATPPTPTPRATKPVTAPSWWPVWICGPTYWRSLGNVTVWERHTSTPTTANARQGAAGHHQRRYPAGAARRDRHLRRRARRQGALLREGDVRLAQEADAMLAAVERHGVVFNMGTNRRWHPGYAKMRDLIASGDLGNLEPAADLQQQRPVQLFQPQLRPDPVPQRRRAGDLGAGMGRPRR